MVFAAGEVGQIVKASCYYERYSGQAIEGIKAFLFSTFIALMLK